MLPGLLGEQGLAERARLAGAAALEQRRDLTEGCLDVGEPRRVSALTPDFAQSPLVFSVHVPSPPRERR